MPRQNAYLSLVGICLSVAILACGTRSNLNQIWGSDNNSADYLYSEAQAAYDRGDLVSAQRLANRLLTRNPSSLKAGTLLGYIYLSIGNIDPYRLARELSSLAAQPTAGAGLEASPAAAAPNSSNVGPTLAALGSKILRVNPSEVASLTHVFSATENAGIEPLLFIEPNTLLVPNTAATDPYSHKGTLDALRLAAGAVCRFVSRDVKVGVHDSTGECADDSLAGRADDSAYLVWVFAHLMEALIYQSVLAPQVAAIDSVGHQISQLKVKNVTELKLMATAVTEVTNAVTATLDTNDAGSMISTILTDLNAVTAAFALMKGVPASLSTQINAVYAALVSTAKNLNGNTPLQKSTNAFKSELTSALATSISAKITATVDQLAQFEAAKLGIKAVVNLQSLKAGLKALPSDQQPETAVTILNSAVSLCASYAKLSADIAAAPLAICAE